MRKTGFKKLLAGLLISTVTLATCMGTAKTVFAEEESLTIGTPEKQAGVAITKELRMPEGTETPTNEFTFLIKKVSVDSDTSNEAVKTMPELTASIKMDTGSGIKADGDTLVLTKNTGNILKEISWPNAGEYLYKVTEVKDTTLNLKKERFTFSQAEYYLHIYIAESDDGKLYVKAASAVLLKNNNGVAVEAGKKIDPSAPATIAEGGNFRFINVYSKILGGGEEPNLNTQSVAISKTVSGELASKKKYFQFEVLLTNNSLFSANYYTGYICTLKDNIYTKVSKEEAKNQYLEGETHLTITPGTMKEISLKHGQYLVLMDCPQGTVYKVTEKAVPGYIAKVHIVKGGKAENPDPTNTAANTALSTGNRTIITGGKNSADFTNTYATTVPTGININNLSFIVMILAALGIFTGFIVIKRHKRKNVTR